MSTQDDARDGGDGDAAVVDTDMNHARNDDDNDDATTATATTTTTTTTNVVNAAPVTTPGAVRAPVGAAVHMTERQLYAFRQQVAAYAHICQQLLQITAVHATQQKASTRPTAGASAGAHAHEYSQQQRQQLAGARYVGGRGEDKNTRGPRWVGTPKHYEALEELFVGGQQPPVRERLTEITQMLSKYGQISESNVYNWFQNRRTREKRKMAEAEVAATGTL